VSFTLDTEFRGLVPPRALTDVYQCLFVGVLEELNNSKYKQWKMDRLAEIALSKVHFVLKGMT
jgi:hypothetical protein